MTRSFSRARTSERGFVLLAAIVLAVLYFGLMELLLLDSARELNEAQRFRARIVAAALAENAAELAMEGVVTGPVKPVKFEDSQGKMEASVLINPMANAPGTRTFIIDAKASTKGALRQDAWVQVFGELTGGQVRINYTFHSQ